MRGTTAPVTAGDHKMPGARLQKAKEEDQMEIQQGKLLSMIKTHRNSTCTVHTTFFS